jgi:hypothetical protein
MYKFWLILCISLAGCSTIPKAPEVAKVSVYVPCVENRPVPPEMATPIDNSPSERVRSLLIDKARLEAYVAKLEAVVDGCL